MMLYTAVEGHHPLRRGTTLATLAAVLNDEVPPPMRAGALGEILMSVLVRDPSARPSAAVLDRQLAEIESAPADTATWGDAPTSYPLNSPAASSAPSAPLTSAYPAASGQAPATPDTPVGVGAPGFPTAATPAGFGPPPVLPRPVQITRQPVTAPVPAARRRGPGPTVLWGVSGTSLAAVLLWWLLPLGGDSGDADAGPSTSASTSTSTTGSPRPTTSQSTAAPAAERSKDARTATLLTPDGIRTAINALEKETGTDRFGDFTVYEDAANAEVMLKGSDTKYDSYTYRPGQGVEKGIIKGSLSGGNQPFRLDGFNWDRVPALLEEADKKLNVADPEYRYLVVRQPNSLRDTPAALAVYLSDDYGVGYLETDPQGRVTRVSPAED
jgi:hypothetical protein